MSHSHTYSGNPLDRGERERRDEDWIRSIASDPASRFLPMRELNVPVSEGPHDNLVWLNAKEVQHLGSFTRVYLLGMLDGVAHHVIDVSENGQAIPVSGDRGEYKYVDVRTAAETLSAPDAGIVAQARAQVDWHNRHGFCSACGLETVIRRGGQIRQCTGCEALHYPRTDPVVISVVADNDRCLLGQTRGRAAQTNRFSALAGFVDQGETIEEAVAREVMEEAGIAVKNVRYHSSQPWPFPSSLMIGCHAEAATTGIAKDDEEMSDVRWFPRDEVLKALDGKSEKLVLPGPMAIAHHIIKAWANNEVL